MSPATAKIFVLDTNVILHDANCIAKFGKSDIVIPITVLEELDKFKRGNENIHFQARDFVRRLDDLTGPLLSEAGASRGEGLGNIRVMLGGPVGTRFKEAFLTDVADHRILQCALRLQEELEGTENQVIVVSKDMNLRLKARSLGLTSEGYTADQVDNLDRLYSGQRIVPEMPTESIDAFFEKSGYVEQDRLPQIEEPIANENFVLRNGSKSALATYIAGSKSFKRVEKPTAYGISPRNSEQSFALNALLNDEINLITISGKAGTGKTLLALAAALECRSRYRQILLARPVVPLSNRDLGFLPGDIHAKLDPYMQPLFDNLNVIRHQYNDNDPKAQKIRELLENEKLVITPLSYIRGRSLQRMFFIVDEAQNLTPHEVKTIITRAGEGTKIVFTGDMHQIDQPYLDKLSNGLSHLVNRMVGQPLYAHITLEKGERSELADLASDLL